MKPEKWQEKFGHLNKDTKWNDYNLTCKNGCKLGGKPAQLGYHKKHKYFFCPICFSRYNKSVK